MSLDIVLVRLVSTRSKRCHREGQKIADHRAAQLPRPGNVGIKLFASGL